MSLLHRIANVFRGRHLSSQLDDELEFHLSERIDELVTNGMPEPEARLEANRRFGNYTSQKERTRDMDIAGWLESSLGDLRHAARQLRLNPSFTAVAVLSLALGIGANTAIFQLIDGLRLRPLPVHAPSQLATIDSAPDFFIAGWYSSRHQAFTYAQFEQMRQHQKAFSSMFAFGNARLNLTRNGEARYADGLFVTAGFLDVLGVTPMLGRGFTSDQEGPDCKDPGVLVNHAFWQRELGGDPAAVGRDIYIQGRMFPVIGVTPPEFFGIEPGRRFDVAVPLCADKLFAKDGKGRLAMRDAWWLTPVGRLNAGWSVEKASAHFRDLSPIVFRETVPATYRPDLAQKYLKNRLKAIPAGSGLSHLRKEYENPLWILLALTGLVLLIACANLANLLLARASAREREIAVRQAMGASRIRLVKQLLSESLLLAAIGAALGAFAAQFLSRSLITFLSAGDDPIQLPLSIDWRVFAFTALLALLTCILFGLAPAIRATRTAPVAAMQGGGRGATSTVERNRLRQSLVVSQMALSLVLLIGALLFGRSLRNLLTVDPGIVSNGVLMAAVEARLPHLTAESRRVLFEQLEDRLRAQPGVESAAGVLISPFSGRQWNRGVKTNDNGPQTSAETQSWFNRVTPAYFQTLKTPLLAGRDFTAHDDAKAPKVAIVNEEFARKLFGGANPVGKTFRAEAGAGEDDLVVEIVGLVRNTKYSELREDFRPIAFMPLAQDEDDSDRVTFLLRAGAPLNTVMSSVRDHMTAVQRGLLVEFKVLDLQVAKSVTRDRLMANLSGGFGILAALLSTLGLYGVMSYMVARRRNEIGIRMAMGAMPRDVAALMFREAGRLIVVGITVGLLASHLLSSYAESLLFGLKPNDAVTLAMGCGLLAATALIACLWPARRAASLDPAVVLRDE